MSSVISSSRSSHYASRRGAALIVGLILLVIVADHVVADDATANVPDARHSGPGVATGRFEPTDCKLTVPAAIKERLVCGSVVVPDRYDDARSGIFRLPVVRLRSEWEVNIEPPLVFIHGGPGGRLFDDVDGRADANSAAVNVLRTLSSLAPASDIVLFEQRGVHTRSRVSACELVPMAVTPPAPGAARLAAYRKRLIDCLTAWQRRPNHVVDAFDRIAYAHDVDVLRRALDVERWSLYGSSYGALVAYEIASRWPDTVHAMVLDSPPEPHRALAGVVLDSLLRALQHVFERCEADRDCRRTQAESRAMFLRALDTLERDPVELEYSRAPSGDGISRFLAPTRLDYDAAAFLEQVWSWLYLGSAARSLPRLLDAIERGDDRFVRRAMGAKDPDHPLPEALTVNRSTRVGLVDRFVSQAVNAAYRCNEYRARDDTAGGPDAASDLRTRVQALLPSAADIGPVCRSLALDARPRDLAERVELELPALLLSGRLDPSTGIAGSRALAERLPTHRRVVIEGGGHGSGMQTACGRAIVTAYLSDPATSDVPGCEADDALRFAFSADDRWRSIERLSDGLRYAVEIPAGWTLTPDGLTHQRDASGELLLNQQLIFGRPNLIVEAIAQPLPFEDATAIAPLKTGTYLANGTEWTLYEMRRASGLRSRFAVAGLELHVAFVILTVYPGAEADDQLEPLLHGALDRFALPLVTHLPESVTERQDEPPDK